MTRDNVTEVIRYYNKMESRLGYEVFLHGTKHFGLYRPGDSAWNWAAALRRMEDRLAQELALPRGSLVLDAGCGVGDVADHLAGEYGLKVTGIDILDFNIKLAKQRAVRRDLQGMVSFQNMSYADLRFADQSFDGVYTVETLVHAADADAVLEAFHRVLRSDGRLVMLEYSHTSESSLPKRASDAFRKVNEVAAMPSFQRFEHGLLEQLIQKAGFSSVTVQDITRQMLPMVKCFDLLARLPYAVARALHQEEKLINGMSAVEFWRYRDYFRYNIYTAIK